MQLLYNSKEKNSYIDYQVRILEKYAWITDRKSVLMGLQGWVQCPFRSQLATQLYMQLVSTAPLHMEIHWGA